MTNVKDDTYIAQGSATPIGTSYLKIPKSEAALQLIRESPGKWFRDITIEQRDIDLLFATSVPWLSYNQNTFVRKIYHCKADKVFKSTEWTVENDLKCKKMVTTAGAQVVGFTFDVTDPVPWLSMKVNVNITGTPSAPFDWGFLSTKPRNIRIFKGPGDTCQDHPWDAMILRDCTWNTEGLRGVEEIAPHKWDILAMKMCEDFDAPWAVVAIKDAGKFEIDPHASCFGL